jgi:hypothetical protein
MNHINPTNIPECLRGNGAFWDDTYVQQIEQSSAILHKWIKDAQADGWTIEPVYKNETVNTAATLRITISGDEYIAMVFIRKPSRPGVRHSHSLSTWKNDFAFPAPFPYNKEKLIAASRTCGLCGGEITGNPYRFSFAGQACENCKAQARKINDETYWD